MGVAGIGAETGSGARAIAHCLLTPFFVEGSLPTVKRKAICHPMGYR